MIRFLTAGESHGRALLGILEGIPSGVGITAEYINAQLKRRKLGYGRADRQKIEDDSVEILAGVRDGKTLGSPIGLLIWNRDWENWKDRMRVEPFSREARPAVEIPRPGHADYVGGLKYDHKDMRSVLERASARETAVRVALGSVARKLLEDLGIHIGSRVVQIGPVKDTTPLRVPVKELNALADRRSLRSLSKAIDKAMIRAVDTAKKSGDSLGGVFEVYASDLPVGLGSYVHWDRRLAGNIAKSLMGLNAIKGVEIGLGFHSADLRGSELHDEYYPAAEAGKLRRRTNHSGGLEGGMTTGDPLVVRAAMKPIATLMKPLRSVNLRTGKRVAAHVERSDTCAVPAAAVIGESLLAFVLVDSVLEKFGGDSLKELKQRVKAWKAAVQA
jgi:chorismate synthase